MALNAPLLPCTNKARSCCIASMKCSPRLPRFGPPRCVVALLKLMITIAVLLLCVAIYQNGLPFTIATCIQPPPLYSTVTENVSVLWCANFEKSFHSRGFIYESINFLVPLSGMLPNLGWWAQMDHNKLESNEYIKDFNGPDQNVLISLYKQGEFLINTIEQEPVIAIITEQPPTYRDTFTDTRLHRSVYRVGRAMFETTWIPNGWENQINKYLDELWVPSKFAKEVFEHAGVRVPVHVVHEGFDPRIFQLRLTSEMRPTIRKELFPNCSKDDLIFFSGNFLFQF